MSDHAALIAEARMVEGEADLYEQWPAGDVKALVAQLRAALEASQQAPTVDREALARELFIADNWGVPSGGADWDEGRVHESRIAQMYRLADGLIASGVLLDAAEVEARGLEKAEAFIVRDVDGTSFTGTSKIIGIALSREDAEWHAAEVKKRDSWHEGSIVAVPILRAQQVREGN